MIKTVATSMNRRFKSFNYTRGLVNSLNYKVVIIFTGVLLFLVFQFVLIRKIYIKKASQNFNLILISVDTLRADHMGVYGYPKNTTPNIDKWAKTATVFTNMRTQVPATYPSFSIVMTGESVFESKIYNNYGIIFNDVLVKGGHPLDDKALTLAQILKNNGYNTKAFVTNLALSPQLTNLDRGFDSYVFKTKDPYGDDKEEYKKFIEQSIDWLDNSKNNRFFLWVHLTSPHAPYTPLSNLQCKFNKNYCYEIARKELENLEKERKSLEGCQKKSLDDKTLGLFQTLYDGEVTLDDNLVGRILAKLTQTKLDKNTIVVFYGDHGEGFDHNYYFIHTQVLYDSSIKIPFIVKYPSMPGGKIGTLLDNTQILPTVLDLLGIPYNSESLDGRSFASLVNRKLRNNSPKDYVYSVNVNLTKYSTQDERYKFIYSIPQYSCLLNGWTEELYDLIADPNEIKNLIKEEPEIVSELKTVLLNYLHKYNLPQPIKYEENRVVLPEDQEIINQLKSLGY